jgi:hypothetical protein
MHTFPERSVLPTIISFLAVCFLMGWVAVADMISDSQNDFPQQIDAVNGLVTRILPKHSHIFDIKALHDCHDLHIACFEVHTDGNRIFVKGSSGRATSAV